MPTISIEQLMNQACEMLVAARHPHFTQGEVNSIIKALQSVKGDEKVDKPDGEDED